MRMTDELYDRLHDWVEESSPRQIVTALINCFDVARIEEFMEFLIDEGQIEDPDGTGCSFCGGGGCPHCEEEEEERDPLDEVIENLPYDEYEEQT